MVIFEESYQNFIYRCLYVDHNYRNPYCLNLNLKIEFKISYFEI
jgi:hypothetical protein